MDVGMNCVNLVITGNPGVGKHTIADLFIKHDSSYQIFDINKFVIESFAMTPSISLPEFSFIFEFLYFLFL